MPGVLYLSYNLTNRMLYSIGSWSRVVRDERTALKIAAAVVVVVVAAAVVVTLNHLFLYVSIPT